MTAVLWSDLANADLEAIDDYWVGYGQDAAERVSARIEAAAAFLATMPRAGPVLKRQAARKWRIGQTPYVLIYRVTDLGIEVLRIRHGREDWDWL